MYATCKKVPTDEKSMWSLLSDKDKNKNIQRANSSKNVSSAHIVTGTPATEDTQKNKDTTTPKKDGLKQQTLCSGYFPKCSPAVAKSMDKFVAKYFFRCNVPFRHIEAPAFRRMVDAINPSYGAKLYHIDKLRTTMLDEEYNSIREALLRRIKKEKWFVLSLDGWSTNDGRHFLGVTIHSQSGPPFFWKIFDTTKTFLNAETLIELIEDVGNELGWEKIVGIVMDIAKVNTCAEKMLEEKYPKLIVNGCGAHNYNLVIKDLCSCGSLPYVIANCLLIVKMILNHQHIKANYDEIRRKFGVKNKLVMPVPTRFGTNFLMMRSVVENRAVIVELVEKSVSTINSCAATKKTKINFERIVNENYFWKNLSKGVKFLEPIMKKLVAAESDTYYIENMYRDMMELYEHVKTFQYDTLMDQKDAVKLFYNRWSYIHADTMSFAHILNPSTNGALMVKGKHPSTGEKIDDYKDGVKQLKNYFRIFYEDADDIKEIKKEFEDFCTEFGAADRQYIEDNASFNPRAYWSQHGTRNYPKLATIGMRLFQMICGAISTERVWNVFGNVDTKARNRLSSVSMEKLIFVYINSKQLDNDDTSDYFDDVNFFG